MADYRGSNGPDVIDQVGSGLADYTNIYGEDGDDTITLRAGAAIGGRGNDIIKGTSDYAAAAYWTSTAGVTVNLASGVANDGLGGVDTLANIRILQDSPFSDAFTGSAANETFFLSGGSDSVDGGGGYDRVVLYDQKASNASITYDIATKTWTIKHAAVGGTQETITLKDVDSVEFSGPNSDNRTYSEKNFLPSGVQVFANVLASFAMPQGQSVIGQQILVADFNGDGRQDFFIPRIDYASNFNNSALPAVLSVSAQGVVADISSSVIPANAGAYYVARVVGGDFNEDGRADVFVIESGPDREPFPGGQNKALMSTASGLMQAVSSTLPQINIFSHGGAAGDVNGDGHQDVVVFALHAYSPTTPGVGPALQLLLGDGKGGFTLDTTNIPAYYKGANYNPGNTWGGLIDVNNDGKLDLIAGTWNESKIATQVYLNDGKGFGTIQGVSLPAAGLVKESVMQVTPIDLNGDNLVDLAVTVTNSGAVGSADFYTRGYIQLLVNDGGGQFHDETQSRLPQSTASPAAGQPLSWYKFVYWVDVNGDGFKDLVAAPDTGKTVSGTKIFLNDGTGRFTQHHAELPLLATPLTDGANAVYAFATLEDGVFRVIANDIPSAAPVISAFQNILRETTPTAAHVAMRGQLAIGVSNADLTYADAVSQLIKTAGATTSVATLAYQFFTGKIPGGPGYDYLVSPTGPNANNLNSAYYQSFNLENRYINFAVNLGKVGEGSAKFAADYGGLTLAEATKKAYGQIFGATPTDAKVDALLAGGRDHYFESYGKDGLGGLGTKAAMVGWLLAEAVKADVGMYAKANDAFLADLADGAAYAVDLVGVYGKSDYIFGGG